MLILTGWFVESMASLTVLLLAYMVIVVGGKRWFYQHLAKGQ
jgi:hypothetical protein